MNWNRRILMHVVAMLIASTIQPSRAQNRVSFITQDSARIYADLYGQGTTGIILAHGGRFNKESWQTQAKELAEEGFRVVALDFRGYGESAGPGQADQLSAPLHLDILAAVDYLRADGATSVSLIGGSMGGRAAAEASALAEESEIDRLVLLAASSIKEPERIRGRKLFITAREDTTAEGKPRLDGIREQYDRAPEPKELVILEGAAHAQFIFQTDQGEILMKEILRFLKAP